MREKSSSLFYVLRVTGKIPDCFAVSETGRCPAVFMISNPQNPVQQRQTGNRSHMNCPLYIRLRPRVTSSAADVLFFRHEEQKTDRFLPFPKGFQKTGIHYLPGNPG